jgi:hypothetical protein
LINNDYLAQKLPSLTDRAVVLISEYLGRGRKMKRTLLCITFCLAISVSTIPCIAATINIFENGSYENVGGLIGSVSDSSTSAFTRNIRGDNFTLGVGNTTITDLHWWGFYSNDDYVAPDNFTIRIFEYTAGTPNTISSYDPSGTIGRIDTGVTSAPGSPLNYWEYWMDFDAPLDLNPDTDYLLSIVNNTTGDPDIWSWAATSGDASAYSRKFESDAWLGEVYDIDYAFYITGPSSVPEPSTLLLFGTGLVGIGVFRRKFKV